MFTRTTISLEKDYLSALKIWAVQQEKSLSQLVNEAVRRYLSKIREMDNNESFFNKLDAVKQEIRIDKNSLIKNIKIGRL